MFDHSVVVPRNYKIAANIVQKVSEEGGSVKTLLYNDKLKHFRTDVLYALVSETIKHAIDIEKLFESTGILVNEPRLNPWLARVLTAELIYGKKSLVSQSKPVQTVLSYKEKFMKFKPEVQDDEKSKVVRRPRYVRINTNLLTTSDAIRAFQDEGYKFIRCTSGSYNDYLQQIQNLTEYDFTQDYHVKTIFVFSPRTKLHGHDLYMENKIILQDKATALAVHLLAPPPGSVVLDMCAAPGMKTTQLAAYMRNEGKVYAVERDDKRYVTLCEFVESTGSKCVETFHKDSLEIKRGDLDDVEYILLDPSCSGSGMDLSVHSYVEESRMAKLTSLQEKFLKHAMNSFSNAKRIVYSTCSIFAEENERVVTNVVKASRARWRVRDVKELLKGQWNNFGSGMYGSMGTRCLYAKSDSDLTTGFFLAVLDRDLRDTETQQDEDEVADVDKKLKDKTKKHRDKNNINVEKQQTKKKHSESESNDIEHVSNLEELSNGMNDGHKVSKTKKKKRNKVNKMLSQDEDSHNETTNNRDEIIEISEKIHDIADLKKKKRKSKSVKDAETIIDVNVKSGDQSSKEKHDNNDKSSHEQELSDEIKTDITNNKKKRKFFDHPETSETKTFKNNEEIEIPKKKKKKHKHHDTEIQKDLMEPDTFIDKENNLLEKNDESENPKKKKKKRETELQKDVFEPVIDMSTDKENTKTPEKSKLFENNDGISMPKKKKKKCKKLEDESKKSVTVPDINMSSQSEKNKCLEKSELLENNEEIEMSKKKKKKRKDHQNEPEALSESVIDISLEIENNNASENIDISLIENIDQTEKSKKIKKKRKERDNESLEAVIDIVSDGAQGKVSKKGKKKENVAQ